MAEKPNKQVLILAAISDEIRNAFKTGNILTRLIIINVAVWITIRLVLLLLFLFNSQDGIGEIILSWLSVPAGLMNLLFKPWTLITYMFLHVDFFHILFNMLWLFWFGKIYLEYLGAKKLLSTYILGGLAGAVLYIIAYNLFPAFNEILPFSTAMGASASVLAVVVATATYVPNFTMHLMFLGPVKLKYIAIFSVALDIMNIQSGNAGGHIAHLGGALFGYIYILQLQRGSDMSVGFNKFFDGIVSYFYRKDGNLHVSYSSGSKGPKKSDAQYNIEKKQQQEKIDIILDKISKSGYESLTKDEKEILFKMSDNK